MWKKQWIRQAVTRLESRALPLCVRFWDGSEFRPQGTAQVTLTLHSPAALWSLASPTLGRLARAYVERKIDLDGDFRDVLALGERLCDATTALDRRGTSVFSWLRHTLPKDRLNISHHYDVSNDFFALWLDARRVYSCAYFRRHDDSRQRAQEQKLDLICRKLMLKPGERFLDIGCGWGGLLLWAAERYGVNATGITLSRDQLAYVAAEIRRRGLADRVEVRLQDYREVPGQEEFDKIASVGMFEHVGRSRLPAYFAKLAALLKPGGLVMNHGITAPDLDFDGLRSDCDRFVERYVFPGGELCHVSVPLAALGRCGLEILDVESLRPHYAHTLWHWSDRLEANAEAARRIVGEQKFRVWRIYMAGAAHAFGRGWLSIHQVLAGKPMDDGSIVYPYTRDHLLA